MKQYIPFLCHGFKVTNEENVLSIQ
jgi:hypothetical protein